MIRVMTRDALLALLESATLEELRSLTALMERPRNDAEYLARASLWQLLREQRAAKADRRTRVQSAAN